jgi:hypothetical protein
MNIAKTTMENAAAMKIAVLANSSTLPAALLLSLNADAPSTIATAQQKETTGRKWSANSLIFDNNTTSLRKCNSL